MGFISRIFGKKQDNGTKTGGMEDYMTLVRVYLQAAIAENVGITNLAMLPDLRLFKTTLRVPTLNNKLGAGEKKHCRKMLKDLYKTEDNFFTEIDKSIKKNCRKMQDVQTYLVQFQGFTQDLMMLMGNLMKWKFRMPGFMRNVLRQLTEKTVNEVLTKNNWKDDGVRKTCVAIRTYQARLGYSAEWMSEYVYNVVMLAKKGPAPSQEEAKEAEKKLKG